MSKEKDIERFYDLLSELETIAGGKRLLSECSGRMDWPKRGIYIFFDKCNTHGGGKDRVVRVGTHALKTGSRTTLWQRLSQHKGTKTGSGNHRGSIFRLLVGNALMNSGEHTPVQSWGCKQDIGKAAEALGLDRELIKNDEKSLELAVSKYIGALPFLWLDIADEPGPGTQRGYIERNSIALLSDFSRLTGDSSSDEWLGSYSNRQRVKNSRLWNNNHVNEAYDPNFLNVLNRLIHENSVIT
jgi:hypothetical protein